MKNKVAYIFAVLFWLTISTCFSQDTLYIMIRQKDVVEFDYSTMEITDRFLHEGSYEIRVNEDQVLGLHMWDKAKRFRDIKIIFNDNTVITNTFNSESILYYTKDPWPALTVIVSEPRRKR